MPFFVFNAYIKKAFLSLLLVSNILLISSSAFAQVSLVPSHHPVYDWLYHQRIAGNLHNYNYESLPLKRSDIVRHLQHLKITTNFSGSQLETVNSYLYEFDTSYKGNTEYQSSWFTLSENGKINFNDPLLPWSTLKEKNLITIDNDDYFTVFDAGVGNRFMMVNDGNEFYRSSINLLNQFRLFGGTKNNTLGFHVEYHMATPFEDEEPFYYDGYYSYNWISLVNQRGGNEGETLSHLESYGTVSPIQALNFSIGTGNLKVGAGNRDSHLFSRQSIPTNWFRLDVGGDFIQFRMTHVTLTWPSRIANDLIFSDVKTKNSPQRFVRLNDLRVQPFHWLEIHLYEMVNYSNRGMEVAYLNPFNVLALAERNLEDQDNGWAGGSFFLRPLKGMEFYTEIIADDVKGAWDVFFKKKFPEFSRFTRKYGLQFVPHPILRVYTEYNRIDPFTYSHPYDLNAHSDKGIGLGSSLPPNSDELILGARVLGGLRSWVEVNVSRVRNGRSITDGDGNLIFNAGENIDKGREDGENVSKLFLDGDPHRWINLRIDASWEPRRALTVRSRFEKRWMQIGNQLNDQQIFWIDLVVGI